MEWNGMKWNGMEWNRIEYLGRNAFNGGFIPRKRT